EAAVRHIAIEYPYDAHDEGGLSLRGNAEEITEKLAVELHARVEAAGVQIIESRFTHLAYAPEIASAMLQRQQAGAVVAARQLIVEGAVGMVETALARIAEQDIVELDPERKAAMVSNLMVVLCGDRSAQPVLNTGPLYQCPPRRPPPGERPRGAGRRRASRCCCGWIRWCTRHWRGGRTTSSVRPTPRSSSSCGARWRRRAGCRARSGRSLAGAVRPGAGSRVRRSRDRRRTERARHPGGHPGSRPPRLRPGAPPPR